MDWLDILNWLLLGCKWIVWIHPITIQIQGLYRTCPLTWEAKERSVHHKITLLFFFILIGAYWFLVALLMHVSFTIHHMIRIIGLPNYIKVWSPMHVSKDSKPFTIHHIIQITGVPNCIEMWSLHFVLIIFFTSFINLSWCSCLRLQNILCSAETTVSCVLSTISWNTPWLLCII